MRYGGNKKLLIRGRVHDLFAKAVSPFAFAFAGNSIKFVSSLIRG